MIESEIKFIILNLNQDLLVRLGGPLPSKGSYVCKAKANIDTCPVYEPREDKNE